MRKHLLLAACICLAACATQAGSPSTTAVDEQAATAPAAATSDAELAPPAVNGPTPVGAISAEAAASYPVVVRLSNAGDTPLDTRHLGMAVRVFRDGEAIDECPPPEGEAARAIEGPDSLPAGESRVHTLGLPCAVTEPGEYQIRAYVHFEERNPAEPFPVSDDTYFGSFFMKIDGEMEPFQAPAAPADTPAEPAGAPTASAAEAAPASAPATAAPAPAAAAPAQQ